MGESKHVPNYQIDKRRKWIGHCGGIAAVGFFNPAAGTAVGEAAGAIVGGAVGGAAGGATSSTLGGEFSWKSVGAGALVGGAAGTIAAPGVGLAAYATAGSSTATGLMGATGGITGDTIIATGLSIYNNCGK